MGRRDQLLGQAGAVCSGCALTQEGNTPFMEAPRALGCVHVREAGEGPQRMPLHSSGSAFSRPDGEMGAEEPGTCRAQGESQVLGASLCSASDSVCDFGQVPDLSEPQFPHLFR